MKHSILKSTPLRLAVAFAALYLFCLACGAAYYKNDIEVRTLGAIDRSLNNRSQVTQRLYEEFGVDSLLTLDEASQNDTMSVSIGVQVLAANGAKLIGNLPQFDSQLGWQTAHGDKLGLESSETYRFFTFDVDGYLVTLGRSITEAEALRRDSLSSFVKTFLGATLLAMIGSLFLAIRSHRRVTCIVSSMDSVAAGNLDARLPVSKRGDDIDGLSANMNDALALLQSQIRSLRNVGVNMAHDLKTPLNRLNISVEEAVAKLESDHPATEALDQAVEEIAGVNTTFESLLSISQIEAGSRKADFVVTDLLQTIRTAYEVYSVVVEDHDQTIELKLDESVEQQGGLNILGDKELLLQLTVNLIENAINHCPPGAKIVLEAGIDKKNVWMRVSDNGPGIPESERERVFERLYRLEESRTTKGAGLGLSLVRAIADLHGALFELRDNKPGLSIQLDFEPQPQAV